MLLAAESTSNLVTRPSAAALRIPRPAAGAYDQRAHVFGSQLSLVSIPSLGREDDRPADVAPFLSDVALGYRGSGPTSACAHKPSWHSRSTSSASAAIDLIPFLKKGFDATESAGRFFFAISAVGAIGGASVRRVRDRGPRALSNAGYLIDALLFIPLRSSRISGWPPSSGELGMRSRTLRSRRSSGSHAR